MRPAGAAAGVSSGVTGGRPVFTSAAAGGEPLARRSHAKAGTGRGRLPPHRSCSRSDQAERLGTEEDTPTAAHHLIWGSSPAFSGCNLA